MASTRTRNLARAIQRANPDMKYTEALRHAEAGRIVVDPKKSYEALLDLYRAAGMDVEPVPLSEGGRSYDPLKFAPVEQAEPHPAPHDLAPILWDGEVHPDPLTFLLGHDLRTKEARYVSLNGSTAHMLISGATASGKSSTAEIIATQALIKPMPWDSALFSTVMTLDPLGTMARVWGGRRGVIAVNGASDAGEPDQDGNPVPGKRVMASALEWVAAEQERRTAILAQYGAGSWIDLSDEVKREERLAPVFVVLDEYMDRAALGLTDRDSTASAAWGGSHPHVVNMVRKGRAVGVHLVLISANPSSSALPLAAMDWGMVRVLAGTATESQLESFFGPRDVPALPTTQETVEDGVQGTQEAPGRARILDDADQEIGLIQTLHLGRNWKALDKWLPRGGVPLNGDFTPALGRPREQG